MNVLLSLVVAQVYILSGTSPLSTAKLRRQKAIKTMALTLVLLEFGCL